MKSPAIFRNEKNKSGFLVMEALIAMSLMTILVPSALALSWSNGRLKMYAKNLFNLIPTSAIADLIQNGSASQIASSGILYQHEFGKTTCTLNPQDKSKGFIGADIYVTENETPASSSQKISSLDFTANAVGTFLTAHNGFVYETTVPTSKTVPDFFIIDDRNLDSPALVSSLVTGPGLAAVTTSGYYAYAANKSSVSQLRVIDIHDRAHPTLVSQFKLPLPNTSTTAPLASSLFYDNGFIYLGTQKWNGNEFSVINVTNPVSPVYINGFNTDSLVNSIYENGGLVYLATPSANAQLDILDVHNPQSIPDLSHFAPAGSAVLEGKAFAYDSGASFETANSSGTLYFSRAGGGFNNTSQYELFSFNLARDPYAQNPGFFDDIPGGVYGIVYFGGYVFLATGDSGAGFQIWKSDFSKEVYSAVLPSKPVSLVCDQNRLYATFSSPAGFATIVPH